MEREKSKEKRGGRGLESTERDGGGKVEEEEGASRKSGLLDCRPRPAEARIRLPDVLLWAGAMCPTGCAACPGQQGSPSLVVLSWKQHP